MKKKTRIIVAVVLGVAICIGLFVVDLFDGYHSPQECIKSLSGSKSPISIEPPNNEKVKRDIIIVQLGDVVLYAYESINNDVVMSQMELKKNIVNIEEYILKGRTFYWNKEWPVYGAVPNQTYDQKYEYWFSAEEPKAGMAEESYPVEILGENYFLNINSLSDSEHTK